ncbi:MAG: hypothetical protein R3F20_05345 [Planctomycetota bacterium]
MTKRFASLLLAAALLAPAAVSQSVTFTGDAAADFAGAILIPDPSGIDVGIPSALMGITSGWEILNLGVAYDESVDMLKVGFDVAGIFGDADGNGDPGTSSPALLINGGTDNPNLAGTESFTVALDLNNDGTADVICGTPSGADITQAITATFSGLLVAPSFAFALPLLPAHDPIIFANPSAAQPDLELGIPNFADLLNMFAVPGQTGIGIHIFCGSQEDDGIGEDYLPGTVLTTIDLPCFPVANHLEVTNIDNSMGYTQVDTRFGLLQGYGCCSLIATAEYLPGVPLMQFPGMPVVYVGVLGDLSSVAVIDLGVPTPGLFSVECKDATYYVPAMVPSGTTFYGQVIAYPTNGVDPFYSSNVVSIMIP